MQGQSVPRTTFDLNRSPTPAAWARGRIRRRIRR